MAFTWGEGQGTRGSRVELSLFIPTSHGQASLAHASCCLCHSLALGRCVLGLLFLPVDTFWKAQPLPSQSIFVVDGEQRGTAHPPFLTCAQSSRPNHDFYPPPLKLNDQSKG